MTTETYLHPEPEGGKLPPYPWKGRTDLCGRAVWYIEGKVDWYPDRRRRGKDRPSLTRFEGRIEKVIGHEPPVFVQVRLTNGEIKWLNMGNWHESRRLEDR